MAKLNDLTGADVNKGIEDTGAGVAMTEAGIDFYRLLMIRQALQLQMRGLRLSNKVPQGTTLARKLLGFKGNKESLLRQVNDLVDRIQAERAADAG